MLQSAGLAEVVATPGGGEEGRGSERAVALSGRHSGVGGTHLVMMGLLKESLHMKHLKGRSSSSLLTS